MGASFGGADQASSVDILLGSLATSFNSGGGFCAGSNEVVAHQRINSAALVFSAALPPLLATAASETIKILANQDGEERMSKLRRNTAVLRDVLSVISTEGNEEQLIQIPSHPDSPMIHINLKAIGGLQTGSSTPLPSHLSPHWTSKTIPPQAYSQPLMSSFEEQEHLLQLIVDRSISDKALLLTRTKKVWEQEIDPMLPSLRICVSAGLEEEEVKKAGESLVEVIRDVLVDTGVISDQVSGS